MDLLKLDNQQMIPLIEANQSFLENDEIYINLKKVISSVISNRDAWPFREAVNEKEAPNYHDIIKNPMDLSIVNQKLEDKIYTNFIQLEKDLRLIVNNSENYNGQFNGFTTNAYSVWRNFRRLTKKYLNHDLSIEDKDAFIFPPRYTFSLNKSTSNLGKRKKQKKQKKSSKFQALQLLYNATQDSIESTFQKFAFSPMSDNENKQLNDNLPKKYQFSTTENRNNKPIAGFYNEAFANLDNYSYLDGYYNEENRNENLVFKSLNEWNKQIDETGLAIVLPDKSVYIKNSPVKKTWLTNFPDDQPNYKRVFNNEMFRAPINGQIMNGQLIMTQQSIICPKEQFSRKRCKDKKKDREDCEEKLNEEAKSNFNLNETKSDEMDSNHSQTEEMEMNVDEANCSKSKLIKNDEERVEIKTKFNQNNSKKRLVIKLSKSNNDWKPIKSTFDREESDDESSDSSSDSSCSSSCSCNGDN